MHEKQHQRLIEEMCAHVGIDDAAEIVRSRHIAVDGTVVGMTFQEGAERSSLLLHYDLGAFPQPGIEKKLLQLNASAMCGAGECFGLHLESGSVVYRTQLDLTPNDSGADLAGSISSHADRGRGLLQAGLLGLHEQAGGF